MNGYEWHATHSEQAVEINQRELLQISNPTQHNQSGCLLSTEPFYFLTLGLSGNTTPGAPDCQRGYFAMTEVKTSDTNQPFSQRRTPG